MMSRLLDSKPETQGLKHNMRSSLRSSSPTAAWCATNVAACPLRQLIRARHKSRHMMKSLLQHLCIIHVVDHAQQDLLVVSAY